MDAALVTKPSTISVSVPGTPVREYDLVIGRGLLPSLAKLVNAERYGKIALITDEAVAPHWLESALRSLPAQTARIVIPSGERHKNAQTLDRLWSELAAAELDRHSLVINVGGGVIGDMGGFAAATYMRGIPFVQVPTTLLSQVDASIGGKLGIDQAGVKNLVGAFAQPEAVIIDLDTLATLPLRELRAGFGEIVKHGLIVDAAYFEATEHFGPINPRARELQELVKGSCEIKARVVMSDEKETGPRKLLNFGHTIGHAVEARLLDGPHALLHGEAISVGMVAEARLSVASGLLDAAALERIEACLTHLGLPVRLPVRVASAELLPLMVKDKKNKGGVLKWTLLEGIGKGVYDRQLPGALTEDALNYIQPK